MCKLQNRRKHRLAWIMQKGGGQLLNSREIPPGKGKGVIHTHNVRPWITFPLHCTGILAGMVTSTDTSRAHVCAHLCPCCGIVWRFVVSCCTCVVPCGPRSASKAHPKGMTRMTSLKPRRRVQNHSTEEQRAAKDQGRHKQSGACISVHPAMSASHQVLLAATWPFWQPLSPSAAPRVSLFLRARRARCRPWRGVAP